MYPSPCSRHTGSCGSISAASRLPPAVESSDRAFARGATITSSVDSYDYHKYNGRTRATVEAFYKRKDRFWFEKMCRKKTEKEVEDFFVANFVSCSDPETLWIGDLMKSGDSNYIAIF